MSSPSSSESVATAAALAPGSAAAEAAFDAASFFALFAAFVAADFCAFVNTSTAGTMIAGAPADRPRLGGMMIDGWRRTLMLSIEDDRHNRALGATLVCNHCCSFRLVLLFASLSLSLLVHIIGAATSSSTQSFVRVDSFPRR